MVENPARWEAVHGRPCRRRSRALDGAGTRDMIATMQDSREEDRKEDAGDEENDDWLPRRVRLVGVEASL